MKRSLFAVLLCALALVPAAAASDSTLKSALKPYSGKLTTDIAYLATFSAPTKSGASSASKKLAKIHKDLKGAQSAATNNQASSAKGRTGRTEVLTGLSDALKAGGDASAAATAAGSGKKATARADAKSARTEVAKAIPTLESGGKALGLF